MIKKKYIFIVNIIIVQLILIYNNIYGSNNNSKIKNLIDLNGTNNYSRARHELMIGLAAIPLYQLYLNIIQKSFSQYEQRNIERGHVVEGTKYPTPSFGMITSAFFLALGTAAIISPSKRIYPTSVLKDIANRIAQVSSFFWQKIYTN